MTLKDISSGPNWIIWVVGIILAIFSIILLTGRGANLIAGYNTASKEKKDKYNAKRLSRVFGSGIAVITGLVFAMGIFENVLPASFATISLIIVIIDIVIMLVIANTVCKK
ncbi:MAG: DUF3784 domain-containing protein [Lachnospiraceae bacterium]|nr:DUF3784 domain-containing protein [Lachnospiraceae bacterium]